MKRCSLFLLACLCLTFPAAGRGLFDPELVRAETALSKADGPRAYAALREIWGLSGRVDPNHIEEALLRASESPRLEAATRVYAKLLSAYARSRRGDAVGAKRTISDLGYVTAWWILGPFDNEGKSGFNEAFEPERSVLAPIVPGQAFSGKTRPVRWRSVPERVFPFGFIDAAALLEPESNICFFAATFVSSKVELDRSKPISLWVGTHGAFKLLWNGKEVLQDEAYRGFDADRAAAHVELQPGVNHALLKVCSTEEAPVAALRLANKNGEPDPSLVASNALENSRALKAPEHRSRRGPRGPLQAFDELLDTKRPSSAALYDYAEYLTSTNGDDPATHEARDKAQQAAQTDPTTERLLLAASLAEDRNQAQDWVDKAEASLVPQSESTVDVLLAQAALRRGGPNPREAFDYYDKVLVIDEDNLSAIRGRAELYNAAGLRRTALGFLERAVSRNPRSVTLLNIYASQLHSLGRSTEAFEVEERYAALRADDQGYLVARMQLAAERRNRDSVERWAARLLEQHPESRYGYRVVASAYRSIGQPERALATLRVAEDLSPEDVTTLHSLASLHGELGQRDEQLSVLRRLLTIRPQDKAARDYLTHAAPPQAKRDEAYAMEPEKFLVHRHAPARGRAIRTLRDLTVTTVYENGLSSSFRQVAFQPLTDAAAAQSRQYAFSYEADRAEVQLRGARIYRGDGRVDEAIEYGEAAADDPSIAMYTSSRNFYVQFPRLEPGDVVELRYRVDDTTAQNEYADYFGEVAYLQSGQPVQNAEYVLVTPQDRKIYIDEQLPNLKRQVRESNGQRIYRFWADEVPALDAEPQMPPYAESLGHVHVSTYKNFKELGRWYWGLSKDQLELDAETRKLTHEIVKDAPDALSKVKAVYTWVIKNTRYVALELGIHGFKPRRCVQTVARGWGDCKDKATVIVGMLRELGIDSTIVIVRTQMRGDFQSTIPSLAIYDHAIAYVPAFDLYLDGTAEFTGSSELPRMDLGAKAILLNKGDAKPVRLPDPDPKKNVIKRELVGTVGWDGSAEVSLTYSVRGVDAAGWRQRYHNHATQRERVTSDLGSEFKGFELDAGARGLTTGDFGDYEVPVSLEVNGQVSAFARRKGDELSMMVTPSAELTPSYASLSTRRRDLRILAFSTRENTSRIRLPKGAQIVSKPPKVAFASEFGAYSVDVETKGQEVTVTSRLELRVSRVNPERYAEWKKFCTAADEAMSHPLVISQ